ncbi:hypothetical protein [Pseudomonas alkylphenolica]|uniref:hypothetical protein n=1 Tax=Pseudomonas alkylphenolica TaxID=237609 RepID=UPI0018D98F88|nr:hypothetical protein [Pseudomonas alkylphenolica]MBH3427802.1 hypothetical protein [Pseudomonas alkylphenolica]
MNRTLLLLNALALTALLGLIFQPQSMTPTPQVHRISATPAQLTVLDDASSKATATTLPAQRLPAASQGRLVF